MPTKTRVRSTKPKPSTSSSSPSKTTTTTITTTTTGAKTPNRRAAPYTALKRLFPPEALYLILNSNAFIINGKEVHGVSEPTRNSLLNEGWLVEYPVMLNCPEFPLTLHCTIGQLTPSGKDIAKKVIEMGEKFRQMDLWTENEEELEALLAEKNSEEREA